MDQGATSAAMSYSRRRDAATTHVTAGRPTLRRTATLQTHATQHGWQRQRSRYRPTDSLQLSRLTHDPARSTTSADSSPPDRLTSALPADPRRQYLPHLSTTTEQTARSTDTQSARLFHTASISQRISSIRTADADKMCILHDFSPLNELFLRNSRQPHGTHMTG